VTPPRHIRSLALIGFMGTGKTTVGQCVANQLQFEFLDTDHLIETRARKRIAEIFAEDGEAAFRALEREVVAELAPRERVVVATGGGLGADPENLARLRPHFLLVCLWATPEVIWQRVSRHAHRPLLQVADPPARIRELLAARAPVYRQADVLVYSGTRQSYEVAQQVVLHFLEARRAAAE
jgi:shikimate kinase